MKNNLKKSKFCFFKMYLNFENNFKNSFKVFGLFFVISTLQWTDASLTGGCVGNPSAPVTWRHHSPHVSKRLPGVLQVGVTGRQTGSQEVRRIHEPAGQFSHICFKSRGKYFHFPQIKITKFKLNMFLKNANQIIRLNGVDLINLDVIWAYLDGMNTHTHTFIFK